VKTVLALALSLLPALTFAQGFPTPVSGAPFFGFPAPQGGSSNPFANVVFTGQALGPLSTCAAPSYSASAAATTGIAITSSPSVLTCVNGATVVTFSATAVTLNGVTFDLGNSTSMSQTAANRIGIATGDSLHLIAGGLGVGVVPPSSGEVQASGNLITAASLKFLAAGTLADILDGKFRFQNAGGTAGFLLNGTAESVMGVKSRTDGAYATVDALGYRVSGAAGASGTCASVTVVNGIVTVCTP